MQTNPEWLFNISSLESTPSCSTYSLSKELYDRARGVEFLFRMGASLRFRPTAALFAAATWFHRFFMRYNMEDFYFRDVAAACIFLATKTEECSRKLKDVAWVAEVKRTGHETSEQSSSVQRWQGSILWVEEYLLEAICFDFTLDLPHYYLTKAIQAKWDPDSRQLSEYAWSIAHDSYRTPICLLFPAKTIAAACYVLAQRLVDGNNSPSLDARISLADPSVSLPTPPSHKPASPTTNRLTLQTFDISENNLVDVADALMILLEFYSTQDDGNPWLADIKEVSPPYSISTVPRLYTRESPPSTGGAVSNDILGRTPNSSHGGNTPNGL